MEFFCMQQLVCKQLFAIWNCIVLRRPGEEAVLQKNETLTLIQIQKMQSFIRQLPTSSSSQLWKWVYVLLIFAKRLQMTRRKVLNEREKMNQTKKTENFLYFIDLHRNPNTKVKNTIHIDSDKQTNEQALLKMMQSTENKTVSTSSSSSSSGF